MKKKIIWLSIFIPGLFYLLEWLTAGTPLSQIPGTSYTLTDAIAPSTNALIVIGSFAYGIGLINVFRVHTMTVLNRKKSWEYSLVVFASFVIVMFICVWWGLINPSTNETKLNPLSFYIEYVNMPLASTAMALLGFYITYAAYRAFKVRSVDGIVMMSVAIIVMVGYDPAGFAATKWLSGTRFAAMQMPVVAQFLKETMNSAVFRSLNFGIAIATIAISWRIWLGFESQLTQSD